LQYFSSKENPDSYRGEKKRGPAASAIDRCSLLLPRFKEKIMALKRRVITGGIIP
jgi:hypothetical protein